MLKLIAALAKNSKLADRHPLEKTVLAIFPIILMGFSKALLPILINIAVFFLLHWYFKNSLEVVLKFVIGITTFAIISSIGFIFDYGLGFCVLMILKSVSAAVSLSFFSLTTPLDDVFNLLSKYDALKDICDIAKSMERFIVIIYDEYELMYKAIKARGGFQDFYSKIMDTGKLAGLLFINTMNRWKQIRDGINARCYRGMMPNFRRSFKFSIYYFGIICTYQFFILALITWF